MAKRQTVEVDEDYLKDIMAGGVSRPKKEQAVPIVKQPSESDSEQTAKKETEEKQETELTAETKETGKPTRKKREAQDYEAVFLERKASAPRRQTYISSELYEKINSFLPVIAGQGFSITAYINNVLTNHLERYKEDINELYERKSKKPF